MLRDSAGRDFARIFTTNSPGKGGLSTPESTPTLAISAYSTSSIVFLARVVTK